LELKIQQLVQSAYRSTGRLTVKAIYESLGYTRYPMNIGSIISAEIRAFQVVDLT
jgi:hypothetical protein